MDQVLAIPPTERTPGWTRAVVACAGVAGLVLMAQAAMVSSATYDEVAYLRVASDWWRKGETSEITRMGSPLTFFKLQAAPAFFVLDRIGLGGLIDRPIVDQASLLPIVRLAGLWIWLAAFGLTVAWSRRTYGPRAMAFGACLFALSPNLLAHGSIMTMEMPLIAATAALFLLFARFLVTGRRRFFVASAAVGGLAFSCKFTTVVYPPILALIWGGASWSRGERRLWRIGRTVVVGMLGYLVILLVSDWAVTGFALIKPSPRTGSHPSAPGLGWLLEMPMPQDWVGFATQIRHQRNGGPSYLLGERRMTGWWYYYPVAMAVKVPMGCWLLLVVRSASGLRRVRCADVSDSTASPGDVRTADPTKTDWLFPLAIAAFLAMAMVGSKRNYGVRYLLPMAPLAIVWISALAERRGAWRRVAMLGLIGQAAAVAAIHPHELSYFNVLAGGKIGGRRVLADSNFDWGQGLRSLAALEKMYHPLTLFYFGDAEPLCYGVESNSYLFTANDVDGPKPDFDRCQAVYGDRFAGWLKFPADHDYDAGPFDRVVNHFPRPLRVKTRYVAVSASLQYGPWGPVGYFRRLDAMTPVAYSDDGTIAIYEVGSTDLYSRPIVGRCGMDPALRSAGSVEVPPLR